MLTPPSGGSFLCSPLTFRDILSGLANALKVEVVPSISVARNDGNKLEQTLDLTIVTNRRLIDSAAVDKNTIDFSKLGCDCDLMKEALIKHSDRLGKVLDMVCCGEHASEDTIIATAKLLADMKVTEERLRAQGGGFIGLMVLAMACAFVPG